MSQKQEKLHTQMGRGMSASYLLDIFDPILEQEKLATIEKLKIEVRGDIATEKSLLIGVSKLICLEDLRGRFESRIKAGHKAAQEINNG